MASAAVQTAHPDRDWRTPGELQLTSILTCARDAFYEQGFHGTSVRDIASRVGVTVPALYYHHSNKEAILLALLTIATEDIAGRVDSAAAESGDDPVLALSHVAEAVVLHMTQLEKLPALDTEARYLSEANRETYRAPRRRIETMLTELITRGVQSGEFVTDDPRELARALLGMWQSTARWFHPNGAQSAQDVARKYVGITLAAAGHQG